MSNLIQSKYHQYKRDTRDLSTWLAQTAVQLGYPLDAFAHAPTSEDDEERDDISPSFPEDQHRSNSAKKRAKQHKAAATAAGPLTSLFITAKQYVEVAQLIVSHTAVIIPTEVMRLLQRCINLRYSCLKPYLASPDASTPGHAHFIRVLENVYDLFDQHRSINAPTKSTLDPVPAAEPEPASARAALPNGNRFTHLAEADEAEDLADIQLPPPPPDAPHITATPQVTEEEQILGILAYLQDVHNVRDEIRSLWSRFSRREVDLITAAVTTNTALELLRKPYNDLVRTKALDPDELPRQLAVLYNLYLHGLTGVIERPPAFEDLQDDDVRCPLYDHLLLPVVGILSGLATVMRTVPSKSFLSCKADHFGRLDLAATTSTSKRWRQTLIILTEILPDYFTLVDIPVPSAPVVGDDTRTYHPYYVDELARELDHFWKSKQFTLLVAIYAQIFVDIVLAAGTSVARGAQQLRRGASDMLASLEARRTIECRPPESMWPASNDRIFGMFKAELRCWRDLAPLAKLDVSIPGEPGGARRRSKLFDCSPMLSGIMLFRLRLKYQHIALILVNAWGSVLSTAHLVAACRHSGRGGGPLDVVIAWPDMDLVFDLHGRDDIFGGKYPQNLEDSSLSFLRMMGYSEGVQQAVRHPFSGRPASRRPLSIESGRGPRGLQDHTQILPMFLNKYCRDPSSGTHIDIRSLEKLLTNLNAAQKPIRRKRKHRSPKFSIVQLLSVLEAGLEAETTSVRFDYVSMHLRCLRVLKKVQLGAHAYLSGKLGPEYIEDDSQLPFVVGYILHWADMSSKAARELGLGVGVGSTSSRLLVGATSAVRQFLVETGEGNAEIAKMHQE